MADNIQINVGSGIYHKVDGQWCDSSDEVPRRVVHQREIDFCEEIARLRAELSSFNWQPDDHTPVQAGTAEHALIGWRARCLAAEKKLAMALEELKAIRQDLYESTGRHRAEVKADDR